jgi:hypothetical protein
MTSPLAFSLSVYNRRVGISKTKKKTKKAKQLDLTPADRLLAITGDNRINVWNIQTGALEQQHTEPNHLAAQYCCVDFVDVIQVCHIIFLPHSLFP